jgi:phosphotransferase system HPr (HPr) family protein
MTQIQARRAILPEEEFAGLLAEESQECGAWVMACLERGSELLSRPDALARLTEATHALETFLDDHGARQNRLFVDFGELVASVRGLSSVKARLIHLAVRLPRYPTVDGVADLPERLAVGATILDECLVALCRSLHARAEGLGISWRPRTAAAAVAPDRPRQLPRNLDVEATEDEREHIAEIGGRLLLVIEASRSLDLGRIRERDELADYVAQHASEDRCRWYESAVHNIQSMYDTYVGGTSFEQSHPWLPTLRGHASIAFHLLEMATDLVHFYERHENDLRHESAKEAVASLVPKEGILDLAVNTCLRQAYLFVESCTDLVERVMTTFVSRNEQVFVLPEGVTLHARPLALIVQVARHYGTPLEIELEGDQASASSLMGLILLAGRHPKAREIKVQGDARALSDLGLLFDAGLGEVGSTLPAELDYLKLGG